MLNKVVPVVLSVCVLALVGALDASAQKAAPKSATPKKASSVKMEMPTDKALTLLVRTAMLTLNDAIETGNFTVLRDKGSPAFRAQFSAAHLSLIFHDLMRERADLSSIAVISIKLAEKPSIDADNRLNVSGSFQTLKTPIRFELLFEPVGGKWRVSGISANAEKKVASSGIKKPAAKKARSKKRQTSKN